MTKKLKIAKYAPKENQLNPNDLTTERVQYWHNGVMLSLLPLSEAKALVKDQLAFVICSQAIGAMRDGYSIA